MLLSSFSGSIFNLLIVAVIFGLVNTLVRPIVKLLTLPINLVTLGLFTLVINTLMLILTVWMSNSLRLTGGVFENILVAFVAAIIISVISTILSWFLADQEISVKYNNLLFLRIENFRNFDKSIPLNLPFPSLIENVAM